MNNSIPVINKNNEEPVHVSKKTYAPPALLPITESIEINGTVGFGSDLGQPPAPTAS